MLRKCSSFGPNPTRAKNAWSSSTCLLYGLGYSKIKLFSILWYLWLQNMVGQKKFAPSSFGAVVGSGIRDEQNSGSGINIPDPQHWLDQKIFFLRPRDAPVHWKYTNVKTNSDRQGACRVDVHSLTFLSFTETTLAVCASPASRDGTLSTKNHMVLVTCGTRALLPPYLLCSDTKPAASECYSSTHNSKVIWQISYWRGIFRTPSHPVSSFLL